MNSIEREMLSILSELREEYSCFGVKAEFEAEGTRTEELMRLKEICVRAGVGLVLKIGGCEAVRDMHDARTIGVSHIVAPMVETPFALHKYIHAINMVFPDDEKEKVEFLINVETEKSTKQLDAMLEIPEAKELDGVVVGRVDLTGSMGLDRKSVNSDQIFEMIDTVFRKSKQHNKVCAMGGGVALETLPFMRKIEPGLVDRYETRKVCFECPGGLSDKAGHGILKAISFELLWLKNKRQFYKAIAEEDEGRIDMLSQRIEGVKAELGV